jgi:transcription elongation factor Elf1
MGETAPRMPKFKVTYRCPRCGHEVINEAYYPSWSAAMQSTFEPCPTDRELGDRYASFAVEIKKK